MKIIKILLFFNIYLISLFCYSSQEPDKRMSNLIIAQQRLNKAIADKDVKKIVTLIIMCKELGADSLSIAIKDKKLFEDVEKELKERSIVTVIENKESTEFKERLTQKKDKFGRTNLMNAVIRGRIFEVSEILSSTFYHNEVSNRGLNALHYAVGPISNVAKRYCETILKMLLEKHIDVNRTSNRGLTPLHVASAHGNLWAVKLLIEKGKADHTILTNDGQSALDLAIEHNHEEVKKYLSQFSPLKST